MFNFETENHILRFFLKKQFATTALFLTLKLTAQTILFTNKTVSYVVAHCSMGRADIRQSLNDCPDSIAVVVNRCNDQVADPDHDVLFLEF